MAGLQRRWWVLTAIASVLLVGGSYALGRIWPLPVVLGWASLTAITLAVQLALFRRHLGANYRPDEVGRPLLADLGPGNLTTLARGLAIAAFAGFLAAPLPLDARLVWAPALLYALGVLPDFLDGALARATGRVTALGGILDMEYDALAMLAVSALAVRLGKVPWWLIGLGLARYLFVAGIAWRQRAGLPVYDLPASQTRRLAAGLQMAFFCVALWPIFGPPLTTVAGSLFAAAILAGFARDWLAVSGVLRPEQPLYRPYHRLRQHAWAWLPPALRLMAGGMGLSMLAPALWHGAVPWLAGMLTAMALLAGISVLLGAGARLGVIGLLIAVCAAVVRDGFVAWHSALLVAAIPLLYTGAGSAALWRGEDSLFERRLGESRPGQPPEGLAATNR